jgi:hypothetical protein
VPLNRVEKLINSNETETLIEPEKTIKKKRKKVKVTEDGKDTFWKRMQYISHKHQKSISSNISSNNFKSNSPVLKESSIPVWLRDPKIKLSLTRYDTLRFKTLLSPLRRPRYNKSFDISVGSDIDICESESNDSLNSSLIVSPVCKKYVPIDHARGEKTHFFT